MKKPALHTPYVSANTVGASRPFAIGLTKLEPQDWIEVDDLLGPYLDEKARLAAQFADKVFVAESDSVGAQAEVLKLLVEHLPARFPQIYRREGQTMRILPLGRTVALDAEAPPLGIAASLVQEDLIIMRKGAAGWRLGAGSLSFPSSWRLGEKFGRLMHEIHQPVPGFGEGSRNAQMIDRMFDNLRPDHSVLRWNWGIYESDSLYHPASSEDMRRFADDEADVFIRVERQTLRKLPVSGDILFTIRIHLNGFRLLAQQPNRAELAAGLTEQIAALSEQELAYKGLLDGRNRLLARLGGMT